MNIRENYVRFLVWLGAEPPSEDQFFREEQALNRDLGLPPLPSLRRARLYNLLRVSIVIPFFLLLIILLFLGGDWRTGGIVLGILAGIILFAISYLFQATVVLVGAIFMFSQGRWLIGLALLGLSLYLVFASMLKDEDVAHSFKQIQTISPQAYNRLSEYIALRNSPTLMFRKYFKVLLVVCGVVVIIYACQGLIIIGSLIFFNTPCPDLFFSNMFCVSR